MTCSSLEFPKVKGIKRRRAYEEKGKAGRLANRPSWDETNKNEEEEEKSHPTI